MSGLSDQIMRVVRYLVDLLAWVIGYWFYPPKLHYLPPINNRLLLEPATKLAEKIKSGKISSEDVVSAYIQRCKAIQSELNAVVDDNFEEALQEARRVDEKVQRELQGQRSPDEPSIHEFAFLGVPFTTKNSIAVKDKIYSGGLFSRKDVKADKDATAIELMKKVGGAIFLAVTNVPECVMWMDSYNPVNGQTNNPYDKSRIPGGSSGGEGALISAAGSVFGIGSDIGGSIRFPSHCCGIYGHKTTPQIVSSEGVFPDFTPAKKKLLSLGPMCRYVADVRPMLKILAGDQLDLPATPLNYSNTNVYYVRGIDSPIIPPVDAEILLGLDNVLKHFIEKGSRTIELDTKDQFKDFRDAFFLWIAGLYDPDSPTHLEVMTNNDRDSINPYMELIKLPFTSKSKYSAAQLVQGIMGEFNATNGSYGKEHYDSVIQRLTHDLHQLLGNNGIVLCPTMSEVAFKHNQTHLKAMGCSYSGLWNVLNVAITCVPVGMDRHGLPYNLQVIASANNDNLAIQVAEELDKRFGGWKPPCSIRLDN